MQIQQITNLIPQNTQFLNLNIRHSKQNFSYIQSDYVKSSNNALGNEIMNYSYPLSSISFGNVQPFQNHTKQLTLTKLSYDDKKTFEEIFALDDKEFGSIDYYENADAFKKYLEKQGVDTYLVNDETGALIGYYQFYMKDKDNLYVENLNLKPEYRGSKKGCIFMIRVCNEIRDTGIKNGAKILSLHVHAQNERMVSLYKKLGFKIEKCEDKFYDSKTNPAAYYMTKEL